MSANAGAVVPFRGRPDTDRVMTAIEQLLGGDIESDGIVMLTVRRKPRPLGFGPGTELKKMLARIGITPTPGCKCVARAEEMDRREQMQPGWCAENIDLIVSWLREEAEKRGLPFIDTAAKLLVRRAISLAKKAKKPDDTAPPASDSQTSAG